MKRLRTELRLISRALVLAVMLCIDIALPAYAGNDDRVLEVYSCGADVGLKMENAGWIVAQESRIGAKRVDRIMAIALTMQTTGKRSGYFDDFQVLENWCGTPGVKSITVLSVKS